ncbi:MAG: GDSL family lipase [Planctomycetota bacterium]|nr:GDSL family lipase [Planctomycetota bacterium]
MMRARWSASLLVCVVALSVRAEEKKPATPPPAAAGPKATVPVQKDPKRHEGFLPVAKAGNIDLLFLGDSITDGWRSGGKAVWTKAFAPLKAANFGISGDRTEHVLWRCQNGELEGYQAKLTVIMIGTNNRDKAEDVAAGIAAIIKEVEQHQPASKILLLAIFPRGATSKDPLRVKNEDVNKLIAKFDDGKKIKYLDINAKFLAADGTLGKDIMPDLLHPNAKGYQIWADAILPTVQAMLAGK